MIVELFSGIGRFETDEEVIYIGIQKETNPTICADVRFLPLRPHLKPRLVHSSVPCTYISNARMWRYGYCLLGMAETLRLYAAALEALDYLEFTEMATWEAPKGLERFFGEKITFHYQKADIYNATTNFYLNRKSLKRSAIPVEIRREILAIAS
jgi:hypothetical protein